MSLILSLIFLISFAVSSAANGDYGFTVELIHRDSPKSPLYNPSETHYHRLANALSRSISHNRASLTDTAEAPIFNNRVEFLVKLSLGTPPFSILAVADTGSDIIWTQCEPCRNCYKQNAPMFNPSKSSTYKKVTCSSPICSIAGDGRSCSVGVECRYSATYGDGSHSKGDVAVDTVTMGSTSDRPVAFPHTVIGCGHNNAGLFDANISGIVGLGQSPMSLIDQMGPATGGKFSYCLSPIWSSSLESSKFNFGSNADVSGAQTISTPYYTTDRFSTFYSVKLLAMSVGANKINFPSFSPLGQGANIIIDSGTTLTLLPPEFYANFATAISNSINLQRRSNKNLEHCFHTTVDDFKAPTITVHFEGGDVSLRRENVFVRVANDVVCLPFSASQLNNDISIYGNIAQSNFLVGYDVKNKLVSFKPANCASM